MSETTHPTDLDTLLKEERENRALEDEAATARGRLTQAATWSSCRRAGCPFPRPHTR